MAEINLIEDLLKEANILLKEIGDLENVEQFDSLGVYPFDENYGFAFKTNKGVVDVDLVKFSKEELKNNFKAWDSDKTNGYNLVYKLNDIDTQSEKTDYKFLFKILATIASKIIPFINTIQPDFVFAFGNFKLNEPTDDESKKSKLYRAIFEKNITKCLGYKIGSHSVNGNKGFLIYK